MKSPQGMKVLLEAVVIIALVTLFVYTYFILTGMHRYPVLLAVMPVFYMFEGFILSAVLMVNKGKDLSLKTVGLIKLSRIVISLGLLIIGFVFDKEQIVSYVIVFIIYYIVYLVFETKVLSQAMKGNKKKD